MYQKVYLHEHISKAMSECDSEIERRQKWLADKDYQSAEEKQAIKDDLQLFVVLKKQLKNLYEKAKTFQTYQRKGVKENYLTLS